MLSVVTTEQAHDELRLDLDQLVREGARRMLAAGLQAEVDAYLAAHAAERGEHGRRLVVRNGHARQRQVTTAAAVAVRAPRVNDRRTDPVTDAQELLCLFDYPALRHEAPHDRVGVRDHHRWAVAAA
jgi:putative transposase